MSSNQDDKPFLHRINRETEIPAGPFKVNYKLYLLIGFVFLGFIILGVGLIIKQLFGALLVDAALVAYYWGFIWSQPLDNGQTTLQAKLFRKLNFRLRKFKLFGKLFGPNRHLSEEPLTGERLGNGGVAMRLDKVRRLGRVDYLSYPVTGFPKKLGFTRDHSYNTYSATMWTGASSFLSANQRTKDERISAFARILDDIAQRENPIYRLVCREQTLIGEQQDPMRDIEYLQNQSGLELNPDFPGLARQIEHTAEMGRQAITHRSSVTLTMYAPEVRRRIKALGGKPERLLVNLLAAFWAAAMGSDTGRSPIGLQAAAVHSYNDLIVEARLLLDPVYGQRLWQDWYDAEMEGDLNPSIAWPKYFNFEEDPGWCQVGDTYHVGFYVSGFNRRGMTSDTFWNILKLPIAKTVTTVFAMVPRDQAQSRAEMSANATQSANLDVMVGGGRVTGRKQVEEQEEIDREMDMAMNLGDDGLVSCFIDLTGPTLGEVQLSADMLRNVISDMRFTIEPLTGMQDLGISALLLSGRGLERKPHLFGL